MYRNKLFKSARLNRFIRKNKSTNKFDSKDHWVYFKLISEWNY